MKIIFEDEKYIVEDLSTYKENSFGMTVTEHFILLIRNRQGLNFARVYRTYGKEATYFDIICQEIYEDEGFKDVFFRSIEFIDNTFKNTAEEITKLEEEKARQEALERACEENTDEFSDEVDDVSVERKVNSEN